jgi:hypothetical protein
MNYRTVPCVVEAPGYAYRLFWSFLGAGGWGYSFLQANVGIVYARGHGGLRANPYILTTCNITPTLSDVKEDQPIIQNPVISRGQTNGWILTRLLHKVHKIKNNGETVCVCVCVCVYARACVLRDGQRRNLMSGNVKQTWTSEFDFV